MRENTATEPTEKVILRLSLSKVTARTIRIRAAAQDMKPSEYIEALIRGEEDK